MRFCGTCGAPVYPLKGSDVVTCKRGHHWLKPSLRDTWGR